MSKRVFSANLTHICNIVAADTNPNKMPRGVFRRVVEGEVMTLGEIFAQMPPWVKYATLALRLDKCGPFTWEELSRKPKKGGGLTSSQALALHERKRARERWAIQQRIETNAKYNAIRDGHKPL